jgi:iron complex outermembrane receptor protein
MSWSNTGYARAVALFIATVMLIPASNTQAQTAGFALEEVVVTARKREESLQATPVAVSAFTEQELEYRQIRSTDEMAAITPNLTFDSVSPSSASSSSAQIFIRGIGQTDFTPVTDPGVGLYIDGVYMARSVGNVLDFVDVDRVEVLRGPQGTLFGRNTIGGAVVVHTKRPTEELGGSVQAQVGDDSMLFLTGKANLPITDNLWSNFAIDYRDRDGYTKRINDGIDTGDRDRLALRGSLLWNAAESFQGYFTFDYTDIDENGPPTVSGGVNDAQAFGTFGNGLLDSCSAIVINNGGLGPPAFGAGGPPSLPPPGVGTGGAPGCYGPDSFAGEYRSEGTFPVFSDLEIWGVSAELTLNVTDWLTVKSITGYREMEMQSSRDGDNTPANIFATQDFYDHEQISQEIQLGGNYAERLNWLVGVYYFQEEGFNINPVTLPVGALRSGGFYDNDSWAVFGQATYDLTDRWHLTAGARYTEDTKRFMPDQTALGDASQGIGSIFEPTWDNFVGLYLQPAPLPPLMPGERILLFQESEVDFDDTNFMGTLAFDWTDDVMVYFSYSDAYKSGGFDQRFAGRTPDQLPSTFEPEEAATFEIGMKSEWADNTVRLNVALFHTDYDDLQIIIRETFNPITFNGGEADIDGAEVELTWVPTEQWYITAAVGWIDAEYDQLSDEVINNATPVLPEYSLVNTPELSTALGIAYTFDIGQWGTLTPRVDWSYRDEEFNDAVNTPQLKQDSYHLVNAALIFQSADEHWEAILGGRNLTDEEYLITGNSAFQTAASYVEQVYGRPREWWLSLKYIF